MCAVIGFQSSTPTNDHLTIIKDLFVQSRIRGLHAYGFAFVKHGYLSSFRSTSFDDLISALEANWPFQMMIGHCRYSTSGDPSVIENNQPITIDQTSIVFNGVISMKTKVEMENEFGINLTTENDAEIALRKFLSDSISTIDWISSGSFSFAGMFLDPSRMLAIRNKGRPLHLLSLQDAKLLASTSDIFHRANVQGERRELSHGEILVLE